MRTTSKLLALALTAAVQPAVAGVIALDFEKATSVGLAGNLYADQGVLFTGNAWAMTSNQSPCTGAANFLRAGSCGGLLLGVDPTRAAGNTTVSFTIDLAAGFIDEFSFVYSVRGGSGVSIKLYDSLDGKGTELQALNGLVGTTCGNVNLRFCDWFSSSIKFTGVAKSIVVSGLDQRLMLDDLTFIPQASVPPGSLPEPGSIALALSALGALGWARKRAKG
jgi:hypothetical protein